MSFSFEELQGEDFIDILPSYQKNTLRALSEQGRSNEEIAQIWLEANGPANNFPFGSERKKNSFYEHVKVEVEEFICNEEKYKEEKKRFADLIKTGKLAAVSSMAIAIANVVGASATLIVPVIVLILDTASKMGINAWCSFRSAERSE